MTVSDPLLADLHDATDWALDDPGVRAARWAVSCSPGSVSIRPLRPASNQPDRHPSLVLEIGYRWCDYRARPDLGSASSPSLAKKTPGRPFLAVEQLTAGRWALAFRYDKETHLTDRWDQVQGRWIPHPDGLPTRTRALHPRACWDRHSRARFARRLAATDWRPMLAGDGAPALVTLTYPRDWLAVAPDAKAVWGHVKRFRQRLARALGQPVHGAVKLEFAPRSGRCRSCRSRRSPRPGCRRCEPLAQLPDEQRFAPHLHLLVCLPATLPWFCGRGRSSSSRMLPVRQWVSMAWAQVVGSEDDRHLRAGTQVTFVDAPLQRAAQYFVVHGAGATAGKRAQQVVAPQWLQGPPFRWWSVWGCPQVQVEARLTDEVALELRRLLRAWWRRHRLDQLEADWRRALVAQLRRRGVIVAPNQVSKLRRVNVGAVERPLGRELTGSELARLVLAEPPQGDEKATRPWMVAQLESVLGRELQPAQWPWLCPSGRRGEAVGRPVKRRRVDQETGEVRLDPVMRLRRDPTDIGLPRDTRRVLLDDEGEPQHQHAYRRVYRPPRRRGLLTGQTRTTLLAPTAASLMLALTDAATQVAVCKMGEETEVHLAGESRCREVFGGRPRGRRVLGQPVYAVDSSFTASVGQQA